MKSKQITVNGVEITAHSDGSITRPFHSRTRRTFGSKHKSGYMRVTLNKGTFEMQRIIAQAFLPDFLDLPQVDHIDGDTSNNNIANLRMATSKGNKQGYLGNRKGSSSKYRGVYLVKLTSKWMAQCQIDYKVKHIGTYDTEHEAAIARDAYVFSQGFQLEGLNFPENHKTPLTKSEI